MDRWLSGGRVSALRIVVASSISVYAADETL